MTIPTNPNETPRYDVTPEMARKLADQTTAQLLAQREAQRRAAEWPVQVDKTFVSLATKAISQDQALNVIAARLAVLEAKLGISNG